MDHKLGRVYLVEEFLENYIGELEGRSEGAEAR
jgi:hypothetical protein